MPLTRKTVVANAPYEVHLTFAGIATYKVLEFAPKPGGGWALSKTLQSAGHSNDAQLDAYALTPLAVGEERLVAVVANLTSITGDDDVEMRSRFVQAHQVVHEDVQTGKDQGSLVTLATRVAFKGA